MALVNCSGCRRKVPDQAATCPHCGAPLTLVPDSVRRTSRAGGKWEGVGFALVALGIVIGVVSNRVLGSVVALAGVVLFIIGRKK
jgi:predicted amidophosphoribosyltransferase